MFILSMFTHTLWLTVYPKTKTWWRICICICFKFNHHMRIIYTHSIYSYHPLLYLTHLHTTTFIHTHIHTYRSVSAAERRLASVGRAGLRPDSAVAISVGAARWFVERGGHHVGGHERWVQAHRSRRGGAPLGWAKVQAKHELRQAEQSAAVSTRVVCWAFAVVACNVPPVCHTGTVCFRDIPVHNISVIIYLNLLTNGGLKYDGFESYFLSDIFYLNK